jgi:hypothetical protein
LVYYTALSIQQDVHHKKIREEFDPGAIESKGKDNKAE